MQRNQDWNPLVYQILQQSLWICVPMYFIYTVFYMFSVCFHMLHTDLWIQTKTKYPNCLSKHFPLYPTRGRGGKA